MLVPSVGLVANRLHRSCPPRAFNSNALHSDPVPYAVHFAAQSAALPTEAILPLLNTKLEALFNRTPTRAPAKWSKALVGQGALVVVDVVCVCGAVVLNALPPSHFRLKLPVPFTLPPTLLQANPEMHCPSKRACLFLQSKHTLPPWHVWQLAGHVHDCGGDPCVVLSFPLQTGSSAPPCPASSSSVFTCTTLTTHLRLKLPIP